MAKLTFKQERFSQELVKTNDASAAAMKVYNCKDKKSAGVVGCVTRQLPQVQREIERLLEEAGVTEGKIALKINEGLEAKVITEYMGDATETEIPDLKTQHKYLESAINVRGLKAPEKSVHLNVDAKLGSMTKNELIDEIENQLQLLKQGQ